MEFLLHVLVRIPVIAALCLEIQVHIVPYRLESDIHIRINENTFIGIERIHTIPVTDIETEFRSGMEAPSVLVQHIFRSNVSRPHIGRQRPAVIRQPHAEIRHDAMIPMHHRPQSHIEVYVIHSQRAAPRSNAIANTLICTMIPKVHIVIEIGIGIILRLCTKACLSSIVTGRIASEFRMNPYIASIERQLRLIQVRLPVYSGIGIHIITITGIAHTHELIVRIQSNVLIITDIRMV